MKSIVLIIACIAIIILAISKCNNAQKNKAIRHSAEVKTPIKNAPRLLPVEKNIWPIAEY